MGGGLLQLVAYGAQDVYLTGNPQITFWKVSYRRYTNFSMELIEQSISGSSTLTANQTKGTVTISRNGDLVSQVYVYSATDGITNGSQIVQDVEIDIGGQRIDKHFNEWMLLWNELTTPASKAAGLKSLVGDMGSSGTTGISNVWIPLTFWFCRNPGLALPLIALQYHEVKLLFTFGTGAGGQVGANAVVQVFCNYVFLDTDERRRMAQNPHEYLIDQVQTQTGSTTQSLQLNFNHPVKELIFTNAPNSAFTGSVKCNLKLNGQDRFAQQTCEYFQVLQPLEYHTTVPLTNLPSIVASQTYFNTELMLASATGEAFGTTSNVTEVSTTKCRIMKIDGTQLAAGFTGATTAILFKGTDATIHNLSPTTLVAGTKVIVTTTGTRRNNTTVATVLSSSVGNSAANVINGITSAAFAGSYILVLDNTIASDGTDTAANIVITSIKRLDSKGGYTSQFNNTVNVYSFSIRPEEHQPSGTCNFSRIDSATLNFTTSVAIANVYAVNYNVLRIMSGMGGLAYSN